MPVPIIDVYDPVTGRKTRVAEGALRLFPHLHRTPMQRERDSAGWPSRNASHEVWAAYGTAHGLLVEQATDMTRDELVAYFTEEKI